MHRTAIWAAVTTTIGFASTGGASFLLPLVGKPKPLAGVVVRSMASDAAAAFTPPTITPGQTRIGWIGVGAFDVLEPRGFDFDGQGWLSNT